ncbi:PREDICTED: uncharacterized protein LOC108358411 [Rhagoletis zephyria]|uniref:uncharacterized protein LOC108358411 n=1 Tax=Rhagoletis zephyria TaxID=28612 RepID=UPI0008117A97|nr:PREDICTED: uncharacterized protein LOC108358411 [Rhagoletis zephyria]
MSVDYRTVPISNGMEPPTDATLIVCFTGIVLVAISCLMKFIFAPVSTKKSSARPSGDVCSRTKVVTTRQQYATLLELLQQKPEIAQGFSKCSKEEVMEFWQNVAKELNSLGPPTKDVSSWKKAWLDWKAYIKRKLSENKKEQAATGGGRNRQHHFNESEEEVIKMPALETSTHGITGTQKSVEHFAEQNEKLDALASNMQRLCSEVERMCDVKEADLEETRLYHIHMQNLNTAKNDIKKQMLEVEQRSLEILSRNK